MRIYILAMRLGKESHPAATKEVLSKAYHGSLVQTVDDSAASNAFFLQMIAAQTLRAEVSESLLAKKPEIDFLLRLAGTSQISQAIPKVGAKDGEPFLAVVASGRPLRTKVAATKGRKLAGGPLSESELRRVEEAALLSARRA